LLSCGVLACLPGASLCVLQSLPRAHAPEILPEIVDVVKGRVPVLGDSGIRRGTDVLKVLALGANAVCVGRVPCWGLGAFGAPGVQRILEMLQAERVQAAAVAGHTSLTSINKAAVRVHFSQAAACSPEVSCAAVSAG
jgi:isopentenyl diphosphate isomerase/L-lactate dehydrogenase-like FMN-dependent dehydrogenase